MLVDAGFVFTSGEEKFGLAAQRILDWNAYKLGHVNLHLNQLDLPFDLNVDVDYKIREVLYHHGGHEGQYFPLVVDLHLIYNRSTANE